MFVRVILETTWSQNQPKRRTRPRAFVSTAPQQCFRTATLQLSRLAAVAEARLLGLREETQADKHLSAGHQYTSSHGLCGLIHMCGSGCVNSALRTCSLPLRAKRSNTVTDIELPTQCYMCPLHPQRQSLSCILTHWFLPREVCLKQLCGRGLGIPEQIVRCVGRSRSQRQRRRGTYPFVAQGRQRLGVRVADVGYGQVLRHH